MTLLKPAAYYFSQLWQKKLLLQWGRESEGSGGWGLLLSESCSIKIRAWSRCLWINLVSLCAVFLFLHSSLLFLPFSWAIVQSGRELATSLNIRSPKAGHSCKQFAHRLALSLSLSLLLPRSSVAPGEVACLPFSHTGQSKVSASSPRVVTGARASE